MNQLKVGDERNNVEIRTAIGVVRGVLLVVVMDRGVIEIETGIETGTEIETETRKGVLQIVLTWVDLCLMGVTTIVTCTTTHQTIIIVHRR